tara:strand:- start:10081 stop:11229 length:1149 start_codon:yes stop_codon:yes gene_type:complete
MIPRSYTFFASKNDLHLNGDKYFEKTSEVISLLNSKYGESRTVRLTLPEISLDNSEDFDSDISILSKCYQKALDLNFRWINQPFTISSRALVEPYTLNIISNLITKHEKLFALLNISNLDQVKEGASTYAKINKSLSRSQTLGFNNFRFGIGFNLSEYTPFFPFSYGSNSGFSVALESLDFLKKELSSSNSISELEVRLKEDINKSSKIFSQVGHKFSFPYFGSDWSLAPLPNSDNSVVDFISSFEGNDLGAGGGFLSSISKITALLKSPFSDKDISPVGFNGVMMSVLEDDALAKSFSLRSVTVNDLLLYSSVCGCGLDMVPLSGDTSEISIEKYAEDTASLAFRLNKPLGVRFMSISNLREGQQTSFSHDFVNNSSVIRL